MDCQWPDAREAKDEVEVIIEQLDSLCAQYISDHPPHTPTLELPVELYNKLGDYYRPKLRVDDSGPVVGLSAYKFSISGFVPIRSYNGLYPRVRPTEY
jgi:hypothetical protein